MWGEGEEEEHEVVIVLELYGMIIPLVGLNQCVILFVFNSACS